MSDHLLELEDAVLSVVVDGGRPAAWGDLTLDKRLWSELDQLGFTMLTAPEDLGGSGGDLRDAGTVVRAAAMAAVPIAEACFLAGPLLAVAGLAWPGGVVTAAASRDLTLTESAGTVTVQGRAERVPWLRGSDHVVLVIPQHDRAAVAVVPTGSDGLRIGPGRNLAGEPRDDATFAGVRPSAYAVAYGQDLWHLAATHGAVARSAQMAGAAERALQLTARHAAERVQFGRPLAKFQVVQHQIARLASDVTTLRVACDAAVLALRDGSGNAAALTAAAKVEASRLARTIAATSHQLHGAIGFTREHHLGMCTRRLWAWREEYGSELVWQERLALLIDAADHDVWAVITGVPASEGTAANR